MHDPEAKLLLQLARIATALECACEALDCLCTHFGARKPDLAKVKRARRAKGEAR